MRVPVCSLKEEDENRGAAEDRMKGEALEESVERPGTALRELRAESIATDVCHIVLLRKWRNGAGWILAVEGLAEEHKICEASAN